MPSGAPDVFPSPAELAAGTRRVSDPAAVGASISAAFLAATEPSALAIARISKKIARNLRGVSQNPRPFLRGIATYYATGGPGSYAAMHGFRDGTRVVVLVQSFHDGRLWSIRLPVWTQCAACRWQPGAVLVDLSVEAFSALGYPLSRGIAPVTVSIIEGGP